LGNSQQIQKRGKIVLGKLVKPEVVYYRVLVQATSHLSVIFHEMN
jgi:hypothetical protein